MFGMGLGELFFVAVIAIIFLGPEKLPTALVEVAKFFKKVKSGINEAKETLDKEMQIAELKEEALKYKKQLEQTTSSIDRVKNFDITKELEETIKDVEKSEKKFEKSLDEAKKDKDA